MTTATAIAVADPARVRVQVNGARRMIRRLDRQRQMWMRRPIGTDLVATEVAWRAGVAEGLRLAQIALRKGA